MLIKLKDRKIVTLLDNEVTEIGDSFLHCNTNIKKSDYVN